MEERESLGKALGTSLTPLPERRTPPDLTATPENAADSVSQAEQLLRDRETTIDNLNKEIVELRKNLGRRQVHTAGATIEQLVASAPLLAGFRFVSSRIEASDIEQLKALGDTLRQQLGSGVGVLASVIDEKIAFVCVVTDDLIRTKNLQAGRIVGAVAKEAGGGGGGKG